ncbi:MAG: ribonuclease HII [Elusimicrobia bacterium]|nr:ribonuclease HII [Elusimicrobiota bacterium]
MQPGSFTLGIDEAGRGPLIGPMVLAGFYIKEQKELDQIRELGVNDSKKLSPKRREEIFKELANFEHHTVVFTPKQIDEENINTLELKGVLELYRKFSPKTLIWDAPVNPRGIPKLLGRLRSLLAGANGVRSSLIWIPAFAGMTNEDLTPLPRIILENKADEKYLACMAASIVAKVTRDKEIQKLREIFGDFGSGYPSDPKTVRFVKNLDGKMDEFRPHIRQKWSTLKKPGVERENTNLPLAQAVK